MARNDSGGGGGEPDRLSALPDCLLHVIMSSLKARQVVQTCVLSKRWRDLWRSLPSLDVDLNEFRTETATPAFVQNSGSGGGDAGSSGEDSSDSSDDSLDSDDDISGSDPESYDSDHNASSSDEDSSDSSDNSSGSESNSSDSDDEDSSSSSDDDRYYGGNKDKEWEDFEDFTVNLMHHCNIAQLLDSFRLHIGRRRAPPFGHKQVAGWLRRAMKYCTPHPASQRKGLSPSPWRLRRLHLCLVPLDNRFKKHVSSVCRNLDDLELHNCTCQIQTLASDSLKTLVLKNCTCHDLSEITSPTLKTLVIDGGSNTADCALVILTPALAYLHLAVSVYYFRGGISTNEMPSLVKASIHIRGHRNGTFESYKLSGDQFKLLCSFSNATSLELSGVGKKVLGKEPTVQEFMNLRNLLLDNCDLSDDFRTLGFFLQSSPNLEKLTLQHCKFPKYPEEKKGKPKLNTTSSSEFNGLDFMCEKLKVEIYTKKNERILFLIYKDGDAHQLIKLLLCASESLSKNNIILTKV
ncbi:unnamed protein product [Urochloa decumbens]|uniref:F-box domain-containing protein n=1 Tax=Urochloa decumbens TaxID=240449 RepID=A0ABC9G354_9POAL